MPAVAIVPMAAIATPGLLRAHSACVEDPARFSIQRWPSMAIATCMCLDSVPWPGFCACACVRSNVPACDLVSHLAHVCVQGALPCICRAIAASGVALKLAMSHHFSCRRLRDSERIGAPDELTWTPTVCNCRGELSWLASGIDNKSTTRCVSNVWSSGKSAGGRQLACGDGSQVARQRNSPRAPSRRVHCIVRKHAP